MAMEMLGNAFAVDGTARAQLSDDQHWNCPVMHWDDLQRRGFVEHGNGAAMISSALHGNGGAWHCGEQRRKSGAEKRRAVE
nr:MAG TPA_asm: hypothetical protein [Caudoviricetes sp.]